MPSHLHLAHRRSARIAAKGRSIKKDNKLEKIRERCKEDFGFFCEYISEGKKKPADHHKEWIKSLVTEEDSTCLLRIAGKDTAILAPRGPLAWSTPVATPTGWKPIGELNIGDTVFSQTGKQTSIVDVSGYEKSPTWEIIFSDGSTARCDDQHRWNVRRLWTDKTNVFRTMSLHDIRTKQVVCNTIEKNGKIKNRYELVDAQPGQKPWLDRQGKPRYQIPVTKPIEYPKTNLCLDPYDLGVSICTKNNLETYTIPNSYLIAAIEDRISLLQGLLDTNGVVNRSGAVAFKTSNVETVSSFIELVQSLGGLAVYSKPHCEDTDKQFQYQIWIKLPSNIQPFRNVEKQNQYKPCKDYQITRSIVDIRPSYPEPVRCIEVEDQTHTFVIKDYICTCNSAKSTVLGLFTAWAIGIHAEAKMPLKILYISYTVDVARPKSAAIKNTVGSKRYQEVFPSVRLKKGATSSEYWSIDYKHAGIEETGDEQFTICCAGLKGSITSKRASLIIIDDCIKAAADIKNAEVRREMQDNWNSVISPTMFEGARAICLGTRFRHDDIFATTFISKNGWNQVVQQALITDDDGNYESYWPEMWSLEYLLKKKQIAPISFSFQYMNQIVRQSELSLSPDLLIRAEIATEFDTIGIGVDLSSGLKDKNDYTVMTLGGRIGDKIHIIDYRRFRSMGNLEKLDKMMELLADWNLLTHDEEGNYYPTMNVCDVWSEAVQYQASLEADFKRICIAEKELHNLKWHPVKGFKSDKLARFRGIMGLFEQRKIVFNRYRGFMTMFDELTNFGTSAHDDCVDSLVHLVNGLMRRGSLELDY